MIDMLPIGSVVILKNAEKRLMIIGYFPITKEKDKDVRYDYSACLFPEGVLDSKKTLLFNRDQIKYVYHYGLRDEEQENLNKLLKEYEENNDIELPMINNNEEEISESDNSGIEKLDI